MKDINWNLIRAKLREAILVLPHFLKNPVQGMRALPDWDWPTMLILQAAFAAICGVLANIVERDIFGVLVAVIVAPIANVLVVGIAAGFFFYTFMFFFKREIPYRQIYLALLFAQIPSQIVSIIGGLIPPLMIIGIAATMMLLFVAFVDSFHLERRKTRNLLGTLMAVYAIFWAIQLVQRTSRHENLRQKATPESLDILEKEMNK